MSGPTPQPTLAEVAAEGLAYLTYWFVILILLGQAALSVLRPPGGDPDLGIASAAICLVWALFCVGMGLLRSRTPRGRLQAPPPWLPVIASSGALISLMMVSAVDESAQPWQATMVAAALVVGSFTTWLGAVAGAVFTLALSGVAVLLAFSDSEPLPLILGLMPALVAMTFAYGAGAALRGLGISARDLQGVLDERDDLLVREAAMRSAAGMAAEVERSLHDTALNTLETIAAHGDHLDRDVVAERCRADHAQLAGWRSEQLVDLDQVVDRLQQHARRLGLALEVVPIDEVPEVVFPHHVSAPWRAPVALSPTVLRALSGAAGEALTNVAKHAGVESAQLLVHHDGSGVHLLIVDAGRGADWDSTTGFGLLNSVQGRIEGVGGRWRVMANPAGPGTVVGLSWAPLQASGRPASPTAISSLLLRSAQIITAIGAALGGLDLIMLAYVGVPAGHVILPATAALLPTFVSVWALTRTRRGAPVGPVVIAIGCATYAAAVMVVPLANDQCDPLLGEVVLLGARAPMMATLLLLSPRRRVLAALLAAMSISHVLVALVMSRTGSACAGDVGSTWIYAAAMLIAVWLFISRIQKQDAAVSRAREEALAAQVRIRSNLAIRAEEQGWVADTLSSAQAVLSDISEGTLDPGDPATRELCHAEAAHLRSLLTVGQAAAGLRRPARIWLRLLRAHGFSVAVRGAYAGLNPPTRVVHEIGATINQLCMRVAGGSLTIGAWPDGDEAQLILTISGRGRADLSRIAGALPGSAPNAQSDLADDSLSVSWAWRQSPSP